MGHEELTLSHEDGSGVLPLLSPWDRQGPFLMVVTSQAVQVTALGFPRQGTLFSGLGSSSRGSGAGGWKESGRQSLEA